MTVSGVERDHAQPVERLKFLLPEFFRLTWVSDRAKAVWSVRLRQVGRAWASLEWQSVAAGLRRFAVVRGGGSWAAHGLSGESLEGDQNGHGSEVMVVGRSDLGIFRDAWLGQQHGTVGEMLGYPACCVRAFERRHAAGDVLDQTWAIAAQTTGKPEASIEIESAGIALSNVLWRWMGLRAIPHLPCSFACGATAEFGEKLLSLASVSGFEAEAAWLRELLGWPVEWSSLHGIAEIKTPILKFSTRTDATSSKLTVRWNGELYPKEGAQGVAFPHKTRGRALVTESTNFQYGLKQVPELIRIGHTSGGKQDGTKVSE